MTSIYADAITAVSTNGDLSLQAGQAGGGVSIASTLKMAKGGDISSASPLVIDTDGNYFDVTGTTNFSAMTVEEGNFFMLQFDGALTITHGSGIELPGAANLTTAAGDRLMCYATAANTVIVIHEELETTLKAAFTQGTEQATTSGTDVTITGVPSGTKMVVISFMGYKNATAADLLVQLGDSGGIETSGYLGDNSNITGATMATSGSTTDSMQVNILAAADVVHGTMILALADTSNTWTQMHVLSSNNNGKSFWGGTEKALSGELTQIKIGSHTGDMAAGSVNTLYI